MEYPTKDYSRGKSKDYIGLIVISIIAGAIAFFVIMGIFRGLIVIGKLIYSYWYVAVVIVFIAVVLKLKMRRKK